MSISMKKSKKLIILKHIRSCISDRGGAELSGSCSCLTTIIIQLVVLISGGLGLSELHVDPVFSIRHLDDHGLSQNVLFLIILRIDLHN